MKAALLGGSDVMLHRVYSEKNFAALEALFEGEIPVCTDSHDGRLKDAEILFSTWGMPEYTEAEIAEYLPRAKALFYGAGSVQKFARPFLNRGVRLFSAWRANGLAVAQYTYAQILLALKGYFPVQRRMSESRAAATELGRNYPGAYDVKVGLLGCGAIGSLAIFEAGHPVADAASFAATRHALALTERLTAEDTVLFLVSGGGSALFELPFITPEEQQRRSEREEAELLREKRRQQTVVALRQRYGKNVILRGSNFLDGATMRERNGQIGGHRA